MYLMTRRLIAYAPRMWKAVTGGVASGSAAYAGAVDGGVTFPEWIVVAAAAVAGGVAVWLTPRNAPAPTTTT